MCSIIATRHISQIMPLYELNSYRGKFSHSISVFDIESKVMRFVLRGMGALKESTIDMIKNSSIYNNPNCYYIVHSQAPTTEVQNTSPIHPAVYLNDGDYSYLWHNGIIKANMVDNLQEDLKSKSTWDTELLLQHVIENGNLSLIDGSFACMMYHRNKLYMFRNEIAPLFINFDFTISSTKFTGECFTVTPNRLFSLDLKLETTAIESTFTTFNSPYIL